MQDLLHAMEFAPNKEERNRIATKMQRSRITRRIIRICTRGMS